MSKTKRLLIAGFILFTLNSLALFAQDYSAPTTAPPQVSLEGAAWTGFGVPGNNEVRVQGDYAYVAPGEGDRKSVDIRNKSNPKNVGIRIKSELSESIQSRNHDWLQTTCVRKYYLEHLHPSGAGSTHAGQ